MSRGFSDGFSKAKKDGKDSLSFSDKAKLIASNLKAGVSILLDGVTIIGTLSNPVFTVGNNIQFQPTASMAGTQVTWTPNGTFTIGLSGSYRVAYKLYLSSTGATAYGRLWNVTQGVQVGTTKTNTTATQTEFTDDITVNAGDVIRPEAYTSDAARTYYMNAFKIMTANPTFFAN